MGVGLQAYLKLETRLDQLEKDVKSLMSDLPSHDFKGAIDLPGDVMLKDGRPIVFVDGIAETNDGPGTANYKVKAPRGNPNVDYSAKHKGGGVWHVIRDGIPMTGEKMTKNEAYDKAESLTRGG